jgi:hypothetical protein
MVASSEATAVRAPLLAMARIGYARVSSKTQDCAAQIDALKAAGCGNGKTRDKVSRGFASCGVCVTQFNNN